MTAPRVLTLVGATDIAELASAAVDHVIGIGFDRAGIFLERAQRLRSIAQRGFAQVHDGVAPGVGVLGRTFATGEISVVRDVGRDRDYLPVDNSVAAEVCIPLRHAGRVIGVLNAEIERTLCDDDVMSLNAVAALVEATIERLGGPPRESRWQALARETPVLAAAHDREEILDLVSRRAPGLVGMRSCLIRRIETDRVRIVTAGPAADILNALSAGQLNTIADWTGGAVSVYTQGEPDPSRDTARLASVGLASWVATPLPGGHPADLLLVADTEPFRCTATGVQVLEVYASHVTSALRMADAFDELRYRSRRDSVTGLEHASSFHEALAMAGTDTRRGLGVILLDVDNLKQVNETAGHAAGDRLLRNLADRLAGAVSGSDMLFRVGGDEFAVLTRSSDAREILGLAERLRYIARTDTSTVSVGVSVRTPSQLGTRHGHSEMVSEADLAVHEAKRLGRNRVVPYSESLGEIILEQARMGTDLIGALRNGELRMVYQPLVDISRNTVVGVESLMRWESPHRGSVGPMDFIPVAEETGLIIEMGDWALRQAAQQATDWCHAGRDLTIAVNVSGLQLRPGFADRVAEILGSASLPASRLVLEITESGLVDDEQRIRIIRQLRALGVVVAIDDFGTGYSSLSYLRRLPIDILKIDRSFVREMDDPRNAAVARTIIDLTRILGLDCVAEGIETSDQLEQMRGLGCVTVQGYHFARPMEAAAVLPFVTGFAANVGSAPGPPAN